MRREGMAQRVWCRRLMDTRPRGGDLHHALHALGLNMVTSYSPRARISRAHGGGKNILPTPSLHNTRILSRQRIGQPHFTVTLAEILIMHGLNPCQVSLERDNDILRQ